MYVFVIEQVAIETSGRKAIRLYGFDFWFLFLFFTFFLLQNIKSNDSSSPKMTNNLILYISYEYYVCAASISGITTSEFVIVSIFIDISMPSNIWRVE